VTIGDNPNVSDVSDLSNVLNTTNVEKDSLRAQDTLKTFLPSQTSLPPTRLETLKTYTTTIGW